MAKYIRSWFMVGLFGLLVACSGGGGGDTAAGVDPGPPPPGGPVTPPEPQFPNTNPSPYAEAQALSAFISDVSINANGQAVVKFQLTDGENVPIVDLSAANIRFTIAKLMSSPLGGLTGNWQSYVNRIEQADPEVGTGTVARLQGTSESAESNGQPVGDFVNNGDGSYVYTLSTSLTALSQGVLDQAAIEGFDLSFEPGRTHRVAIQFDGAPGKANPIYDWIPESGATTGIFTRDIAATENCNRCHDPLAIHGGGRREVEYCVTCHNAGSTDANSTNTVDFKVMVHKIHRGASLPSVEDGGEYAIYGFRNSKHDYSHLHFPQDIRNCVNCHAGSATGADRPDLVLTSQGDNWAEVPSQAACGSCHDDVVFAEHEGGQVDDTNCASCHSQGGEAGSIQDSHSILTKGASAQFKAEVVAVNNSMPGEIPTVSIRLSNPDTGESYDLLNDPVFSGASVNVRMAWDTRDYTNTGNGQDNTVSVVASALTDSTDNGDGSYSVTMPIAIPDGSEAPGIAASGSGAAVIEGRLSLELEEGEGSERVPLANAHSFFSIDEPDGKAVARREAVDLTRCLTCHDSLSLHGGNRTDNIDSCVTCHNPRNTDLEVREIAATPPTDGKDEQSIDFKVMIHGIHAAGILEHPLQIVGFQGRSTNVFDEEEVHFPGDLANCTTCHTDDGYKLPLSTGVLGTTVDSGEAHWDPTDDTVVTPVTAVCSSCHDDAEAVGHMTLQGGNFATTQAAIDSGAVVETCSVCHGEGSDFDVAKVHRVHPKPL